MDLEKLEKIFKRKYEDLLSKGGMDDLWLDYCDQHKVQVMHPEWVKECFNEEHKGSVCIFSPENEWWLLVPKNIAEKALVLGYLP